MQIWKYIHNQETQDNENQETENQDQEEQEQEQKSESKSDTQDDEANNPEIDQKQDDSSDESGAESDNSENEQEKNQENDLSEDGGNDSSEEESKDNEQDKDSSNSEDQTRENDNKSDDENNQDNDKENNEPSETGFGENNGDDQESESNEQGDSSDDTQENESNEADSKSDKTKEEQSNDSKNNESSSDSNQEIDDKPSNNSNKENESNEKGKEGDLSDTSSDELQESKDTQGQSGEETDSMNEENNQSNNNQSDNTNEDISELNDQNYNHNSNENNQRSNSKPLLFNEELEEDEDILDDEEDYKLEESNNSNDGESSEETSEQDSNDLYKDNESNETDKENDESSKEKESDEEGESEEDNQANEETETETPDLTDIQKKKELLERFKSALEEAIREKQEIEQRKAEFKERDEISEHQEKPGNNANQFLGKLRNLPPFDQRHTSDGYAIDTETIVDVDELIIKKLVNKFLRQQFCNNVTDLNRRSNSLEKSSGMLKWEIRDLIIHLETEQVPKIPNDKYGYDYANGRNENIPLSFYFDLSGSMSAYTALLAQLAIELLKKDVKVLVGYNQNITFQIDSIDKNTDIKSITHLLTNSSTTNPKIKYKSVYENLDRYLVDKKAEKVCVFADFDPRQAVITLSNYAQVYWFCFESQYRIDNLVGFRGFAYPVHDLDTIAQGLIKVSERRFESLVYLEKPIKKEKKL